MIRKLLLGLTVVAIAGAGVAIAHQSGNKRTPRQKLDFPAGPRMSGHYENHLNWDLVIVFRYAWPSLDEATRARVRDHIQRMLDWCLAQSMQSDGSFRTS